MVKRKVWLTADFHFNHPNIIKYCDRPFKDIFEMDEHYINTINSMCASRDILYHLGDMLFPSGSQSGVERTYEYYADQIDPEIIPFKGNHDDDEMPTGILEGSVRIGKHTVFMSHKPKSMMKINLCGHEHDKFRIQCNNKRYTVNVGVDVWDHQPIQFIDVLRIVRNHKNFFSGVDENGEQVTEMPTLNERWIKKADDYDPTSHNISHRHWVPDLQRELNVLAKKMLHAQVGSIKGKIKKVSKDEIWKEFEKMIEEDE
jgi:calcineurin-like phosphoesterase family protein